MRIGIAFSKVMNIFHSHNFLIFCAEKHIQSSEHELRFEDFFWNGSGDEPLTLSLKSNARLTMNGFVGRETFIKTATVIATVYVGEDSVNQMVSLLQNNLISFVFISYRRTKTRTKKVLNVIRLIVKMKSMTSIFH